MPRLVGTIRYQGAPHQKLKHIKPFLIEALEKALLLWWRKFFGKRFTVAGQAQYRLRKRTQKYQERKQARFGHQRPLEYSGRMKREMTRAYRMNVRSPKKAKITMTAPAYVNYRVQRRAGAPIDKRHELIRTVKPEITKMAKLIEKIMAGKLGAADGPVQKERFG